MKHETEATSLPRHRKATMPNYCTNYLGVHGPTDDVRRFHAGLLVDKDSEETNSICQTYWPMPEILHGTHSPDLASPEMPASWTEALASGEITQERYDALSAERRSEYAQNQQALAETGYTNWYSWAHDNWGTKWPDCDTLHSGSWDHNDGTVEYRYNFQTPWGPCDTAISNISTLFPTLVFDLTYSEEGMCFAGGDRYQNGVQLSHVYYEDADFPTLVEDEDGNYDFEKFSDDLSELMSRIEDELSEGVGV